MVVPACMYAFANVTAEWNIEFLDSRLSRIRFRIMMSVLLLRKRKSRFIAIVISPDRIWTSCATFAESGSFVVGRGCVSEWVVVSPLAMVEEVRGDDVGRLAWTFWRNSWVAEEARSNAIWRAIRYESPSFSVRSRRSFAAEAASLRWTRQVQMAK